jgi:hypothetical protein
MSRFVIYDTLTPLLLTVLLPAMAAGAHRPSSSKVSFAKPITTPTGMQYPQSLAAGDLNGDGFPDLVTVTTNGGNYPYIVYAFGKGNGHFGKWHYGPATNDPAFVLLADATGNGKLDALTNDGMGTDIMIALGNGKGGFPHWEDVGNTESPADIAVADLNGDGIPDIVGTANGRGAMVMLGKGRKQFGDPVFYPTGGDQPSGIAVGDMNNDGIPDLVVANYGYPNDPLAVLLGKGHGKFQNPVTYNAGYRPSIVALGDFNNDGNLDVAVVTTSPQVNVLLGNGDGTLSPPKGYATGAYDPTWLAVADFNGDGILDLAVSSLSDTGPDLVSILLGNGDGTFQKPRKFPIGYGASPWQLVVADFNHDGRPDIATVNGFSSTVSVLLNTTKFPVRPQRH